MATILVVSEHKSFGIGLKKRLEAFGHLVLCAASPDEALKFLREQTMQVHTKEIRPTDATGDIDAYCAERLRHKVVISTIELVVADNSISGLTASEFICVLGHEFPAARAIVILKDNVAMVRRGTVCHVNARMADDESLNSLVTSALAS